MSLSKPDLEMLTCLAQAIFDKKGFNILTLDARDFSSLADYFVIAEGRSDRHVQALCDAVLASQGQLKRHPIAIEGKKHGEWVAIDYGDLIIHLFSPEWREKYALEELWRECLIIDVPLTTRSELGSQEVYD